MKMHNVKFRSVVFATNGEKYMEKRSGTGRGDESGERNVNKPGFA